MVTTLFSDTLFLVTFILLLVFAMVTGLFSTMKRPRTAKISALISGLLVLFLIGYGIYLV